MSGGMEIVQFTQELLAALPLLADLEGEKATLHGARVALLASRIAAEILESDARTVFLAGLFHDIGANGSELHPLRARSLADYAGNPWLKAHPVRASHVLKGIPFLQHISEIVLEHHEWYDGGGFPFGRRALDIIPEAQALRLADALDIAMVAFGTLDAAFEYLEPLAGKEYDPDFFRIFRSYYEDESWQKLWYEPQSVLAELRRQLKRWSARPSLNDLYRLITLFDIKKRPLRGHTRRVTELVRECAELAGLSDIHPLLAASLVHELYTTYQPYCGSYIGSVSRCRLLSLFPQVEMAFLELEEDPWLSELVRAACLFDGQVVSSGEPVTVERVLTVLSTINGSVNPEILLLLKKTFERRGTELYAGTPA